MSLAAVPLLRHTAWAAPESVPVILEGRADDLGDEIVSFGFPLPFGFLRDSQNVRITDERGAEVKIAVRSLEPWRVDGRDGSIRSLLFQFKLNFSKRRMSISTTLRHQSRRRGAGVFTVSACPRKF